MAGNRQHNLKGTTNDRAPIHALSEIISPLRLGTYLSAAGHDPDRALNLYLWNAKMGEAFHLPIQAVEVGLRNRVSDGLQTAFGNEWWRDTQFLQLAIQRRQQDIEVVKRRLARQGRSLATGQVIAGLSFGFWVSMLDGRYNPGIWGAHLRTAFPDLPASINRGALRERAGAIADLRNRISHHEPIFKRNLSTEYSKCMEMLHWLCPEKAKWIKPHCRVPLVLREKP